MVGQADSSSPPDRLSCKVLDTFVNSETTGPIKLKFYIETPWHARTKVCSNGPGHMNKMAPMPIYGKTL